MHSFSFLSLSLFVLIPPSSAQQFPFPDPAAQDPAALSEAVTKLAIQALPVYKEADRETYLTNLSALQAAGGQYDEAARSYGALREFRRSARTSNPEWRDLQYEIYVRAKSAVKTQKLPFDEDYRQAFRAVLESWMTRPRRARCRCSISWTRAGQHLRCTVNSILKRAKRPSTLMQP